MAVPELVEQVLLQLSLKDILLAQRVSRAWQTIIAKSLSIQKALFFRPVDPLPPKLAEVWTAYYWKCADAAECTASGPGLERAVERGITRWAKKSSSKRQYRIFVNPILVVGRNPSYQPYFHEGAMMTSESKISESERWRRPEASWRKMLLTQPPLTHVLVDHAVSSHWHLVEASRETSGLTLEELYDSTAPFGGTVRAIWGDEDFGLGLPSSSTAAEVLAAIRGKPGEHIPGGRNEELYSESDRAVFEARPTF